MNAFHSLLAGIVLVCLTSCLQPTGSAVGGVIGDGEMMPACELACDPGTSSGLSIVSSIGSGSDCCVTFEIKSGVTNPGCYHLRTWDGSNWTSYTGSAFSGTDQFTVCFEQEGDCFIIELNTCGGLPVVSYCDVFDNQC